MKQRLPWVPRYCRDLARDVVELDRLPPAEREWYVKFLDEFYNASNHGISTPEQIAEANRRKFSMRDDLFAAGFRAAEDPPEVGTTAEHRPGALDTPKAKELLRKLREVRPVFVETDGRRRAQFASPLAERRFRTLQRQLQQLLNQGGSK